MEKNEGGDFKFDSVHIIVAHLTDHNLTHAKQIQV